MAEASQAAILMRYLAGEISFADWVDSQDSSAHLAGASVPAPTGHHDDEHAKRRRVEFAVPQGFCGPATTSAGKMETSSPTYSSSETTQPPVVPADEAGGDASDSSGEDPSSEDDDAEEAIAEKEPGSEDLLSSRDFILPNAFALLNGQDESLLSPEQKKAKLMIPVVTKIGQIIPECQVRYLKQKREPIQGNETEALVRDFHNYQLRKRGRQPGRKLSKLPEFLRLNMGQANLHVAKGEFREAAEICMDIIKEAPSSALPFKTLSFIYEEQGNAEMALQYSLIAAFLGCRDPNEWLDLSVRCQKADLKQQALTCYDRACRLRPRDVHLHWTRATMYFDNGDYNKSFDYYQSIMKMLIPRDCQKYISVCTAITELYLKLGFADKARETLARVFELPVEAIDVDTLSMYTDMLIAAQKHKTLVEEICKFCGVKVPARVASGSEDASLPAPKFTELESQGFSMLQSALSEAARDDYDFSAALAKGLVSSLSARSSAGADSAGIRTGDCAASYDGPDELTDQPPADQENDLKVPEYLPISLRVKLARSLMKFGVFAPVETILEPMFYEDINVVGDCYLTIGDGYMESEKYVEALRYYQDAVASPQCNQASVWLKIAECYEELEESERKIEAFFMVLMLSPHQVSVRLSLAAALREQGRCDEALRVLKEYNDKEVTEEVKQVSATSQRDSADSRTRLKPEEYESWHQNCMQLYAAHQFDEFICNGFILLHSYLLANLTIHKKRTISKVVMWQLLMKFFAVASRHGEHGKVSVIIDAAMLFRPYADNKVYRRELDYLATTAHYVAGDYSKAFDAFRLLVMHESEELQNSHAVWNLFSFIANKMLDKRHHRYTLRLLFKKASLVPLIIHNGINSHLSGTYKYAIGEFSRAFRCWPSYPLISLLLGVSYLHLACQKFHSTKHSTVLHGMTFIFLYFRLRKGTQEAYFNVGRAFHHIGLVHMAVHYYNKALEFPLHEEKYNANNVEYDPFNDLHREAAYNLSLIYRASGNNHLARKMLYKYCSV